MSEQPNNGAAQFRADLPESVEQEAVRTTIVGGRPPGNGQPVGRIPRGIEVLLKKAAVDEEFRVLLLDDPSQAAAAIELELEPVEQTMLQAFPKELLATVIDQTEVPLTHRRAFLGTAAAAMLALLTGSPSASAQRSEEREKSAGIQPVMPSSRGIQPDVRLPRRQPQPLPKPNLSPEQLSAIPNNVRRLVAETMKVSLENVDSTMRINLGNRLADFRREIYKRFDVRLPLRMLSWQLNTLESLTEYIVESLDWYEPGMPSGVLLKDIEERVARLRTQAVAAERVAERREEAERRREARQGWGSAGIRPDSPALTALKTALNNQFLAAIRQLVAEKTKTSLQDINDGDTSITLSDTELAEFRKEIYRRFDVRMPLKTLKSLNTVELLTDYIIESVEGYVEPPVFFLTDVQDTESPVFSFGMQPIR